MRPGARVGRYEVVRELGAGGAGAVFEAIDTDLQRHVALKVMLAPEEPGAERRFELEARALSALAHPNVVRLYDLFRVEGRLVAAMQLLGGGSLQDRLQREGPLPVKEAATLMRDVARAIAHVHERGILHRDLKPANILLDDGGRPLVSDFGLALAADRERLTLTGEMLGTPSFMAPEQVSSSRGTVGAPADVYALGATLVALLTGAPPFVGNTLVNLMTAVFMTAAPPPSARRPEVDPVLDAICLRCLEKEPARRFPSAAALADALDAYLASSPRARARRRGRGPGLVAGAVGGVALVAAILAIVRARRPDDVAPSPVTATVATTDSRDVTPPPAGAPAPPPLVAMPARSWRQREGMLTPRFGLEGGLAWDETRKAILCYGGITGAGQAQQILGDFWAWDGDEWACIGLGPFAPGERYSHAFAADPARGRPVLFGGMTMPQGASSGRRLVDGDVWEWDGREWTPRRVTSGGDAPGTRFWVSAASSPERGSVLLFGGRHDNEAGDLPELLEWSGQSARWTRHVSDPAPEPRNCAGLVWDSRRRVLVLFGGAVGKVKAAPTNDTWEWDGVVWERRYVAGPPARSGHAMIFDGSRTLVFGGRGADGEALGDTWTWDGARWEQLELEPRPRARYRHGMGWDPRREVVVVLGGRGDGENLSDVWELGR